MENCQVLKKEDEVELIELIRKIWSAKKSILVITSVFFVLGFLIAVLSSKEYTASTIIVPQTSGSKLGGNLGGLAALAGVNLGSSTTSTEAIPPTLYPKLTKSIPFKRKLLQTPLSFEGLDKPISYQEYFTQYAKPDFLGIVKKYTIGLPALLFSKNESEKASESQYQENILLVDKQEEALHHLIGAQLKLNVNEKEGFVTLEYSMPQALPAAQMLQRAQELLQNSIIEFKVKKAKEELLFIEQRYFEAEKDFKAKQYALANFQDRNRNFSSSLPQTRLQQLQTEFNLAYDVYSELAKQLETQKIKVKEETPVFTVIEPVSVPNQKSKPKRGMIIAIWTFLGLVIGVGVVFVKDFFKQLKAENQD